MLYLKDMWKDTCIFSFLCNLLSSRWDQTCQYHSMWMVASGKVFLLATQPLYADIYFLLDVWNNILQWFNSTVIINYPVTCIYYFIDGHPFSWVCFLQHGNILIWFFWCVILNIMIFSYDASSVFPTRYSLC